MVNSPLQKLKGFSLRLSVSKKGKKKFCRVEVDAYCFQLLARPMVIKFKLTSCRFEFDVKEKQRKINWFLPKICVFPRFTRENFTVLSNSLFNGSETEDLFQACALSSPVTFLTSDHVYKSASSARDLGTRLSTKHTLVHPNDPRNRCADSLYPSHYCLWRGKYNAY